MNKLFSKCKYAISPCAENNQLNEQSHDQDVKRNQFNEIVSTNNVDQEGPIHFAETSETPHDELDIVEAEFSRNIFNAYLLCKYKLQLDQRLCRDMACAVFATYIVQFAATYLLTIVFKGSHGYRASWDWQEDAWGDWSVPTAGDLREREANGELTMMPTGNNFIPKSFYIWPFIIITLVSVFKETIATWTDMKMFYVMLVMMASSSVSKSQRQTRWNVIYMVKIWQLCFDSVMSFYYVWFIVTIQGDHDDESMLHIILNLFAFEFILQLDEQVYCLFIANLRMWSTVDPKKLDDAFQGKYWTIETSPMLRRFQFLLLISLSLMILCAYAGSLLVYRISLGVAGTMGLINIAVMVMDGKRAANIFKARQKAFRSGSKALFQYDFWGIEDNES